MSTIGRARMPKVFERVGLEIGVAGELFGDQFDLTDAEWCAVLTEEVGEAAHEVTQYIAPTTSDPGTPERLRREVQQVAAVAIRWLVAMDLRP